MAKFASKNTETLFYNDGSISVKKTSRFRGAHMGKKNYPNGENPIRKGNGGKIP